MKKISLTFKCLTVTAIMGLSVIQSPAPIFTYYSFLDGPSEQPANASPGSGVGSVVYDSTARTLTMNVSWSGLVGTTTVSHIHGNTATPFAGTAGVVLTPGTLPGFPSGLTSGTYSTVLDLSLASTYPAAFITANGGTTLGAENAIMNGIANGRAYWNIHSSVFGGGEIRGFFTTVPEPGSAVMLGLAAAGLLARKGFRRKF